MAVVGKRKWAEEDWDVAMAAQTFVAVFASTEVEEKQQEEPPKRKRGRPKKTGAQKSKKAKTEASTKGKGGKKPTRRSSRAKSDEADEENEQVEEEEKQVEQSAEQEKPAAPIEEFWLAQLQDDVTDNMLDDDDAIVRATWLNKLPGGNNRQYAFAYDEQIDVQTILCHVYLREMPDGTLELTPKSLARVQRSLARTKGEEVAEGEEEADDERPPPSLSKRQTRSLGEGAESGKKGGRSGGGKSGTKKLSKREAALHIPPLYTSVDLDKYEDREIHGSQPYTSFKDDVSTANREVIRAVVTKNHKLLKKLTTDKKVYKELSSFNAPQSVDVTMTALRYAIDADDVTAAAMLVNASKIEKKELAQDPEVALPSHSTGKHTSAFSDYNRRAINASRGGKEGNNALLEDATSKWTYPAHELSGDCIWKSRNSSARMLTLLFPTGDWNKGYYTLINIAHAARRGLYQLLYKVVETLHRNGGSGFNELHYKVLSSDPDEELPQFRSASAVKMAHQTRIRPIHLAAINPNKKYLEALWETSGNEFGSIKDDQGFEPIHYAAACEGTAPLEFLLEHRCSLFGRTKTRLTPLMCAITAYREDNAVLILEHAEKEGTEVLQQLVAERGTKSQQPIHYAAAHGCAKVLEKLLASGADANGVCADKATPLCLAAKSGSFECVKILIAHGAKVNAGDKLKKTPLIHAVKNGHTTIAAYLINSGANVNAFDTSENSAVHYAASYGWLSSLELLADAGADFWSRNCWGFVPLACALLKQRQVCAEFIFERDTQKQFLDFRDRQGRTMLFLQTKHSKNLSQIKYLLDKGLNPNICDAENEYPLSAIISRATEALKDAASPKKADELSFYLSAVRLLLEHKAAPQCDLPVRIARDAEGAQADALFQPLQIAIRGRQQEIFELLLVEFNADPSAKSSDGSDAWMTAASIGDDGDFFLKKLIESCSKKNKKTIELSGRQGIEGKENFFHVVASNNPLHFISPKLITQVVSKCTNALELMAAKNSQGFSPLMLLLMNERPAATDDLSIPSMADKLEDYKSADKKYSSLVGLFAEYTADVEAFIQTVKASDVKHLAEKSKNQSSVIEGEDNGNADSQPEHSNSGSNTGSDDGDDDDEEDDDDNDEEEEEEEDEDRQANTTTASTDKVNDAEGEVEGPSVQMTFQTALHLAANRKLRADSRNIRLKWFGENTLGLLFHKQPELLDKELVNYPDFTNFKTPLDFAVNAGDIDTVRVLLTNNANPNHSSVKCESCKIAFFTSGQTSVPKSAQPCSNHCEKNQLAETALYAAVKLNRSDIVGVLLKHGANVDCVAKETGNTPLHLALQHNNAVITRSLLKSGASMVKPNTAGALPLHVAVQTRASTIVPEEMHKGEIKYTQLSGGSLPSGSSSKSSRSEPAIVVALRDPRAKTAVFYGDGFNRTPIHFAAANRDLALLRALVDAAADKKKAVGMRDHLNRTPLHYAVNAAVMSPDAAFHVERFLLQCGSDVNAQDAFGLTALHFALKKVDLAWQIQYDEDARARKNENSGANASPDDDYEANPEVYEATKTKKFLEKLARIPGEETDPVETLSNLVGTHGIRVNAQDALGRTPLHLAAATGAFVSVSSLLSVHKNDRAKQEAMELTDHESVTPLGYAVLNLRQTTIMTLLQNHADVSGRIQVKAKATDGDVSAASDEDKKNKKSVKTRSYFYHAVSHSLTGICHMLLNAKFSRRQAIEDAVRCGKFQLASNLIVGTDSGSTNALLVQTNDKGDTLLHALAKVKSHSFEKLAREIAWTLVDAGVGVSEPNEAGNTALHYAARNGNIHLMDFLLHNGCDLNVTNERGETPLIYMLKKGYNLSFAKVLELLEYFVHTRTGLNMHACDNDGANMLSAFLDRFVKTVDSEIKFFEWVEKMLKGGVDPNSAFQSQSDTEKDLYKNAQLLPSPSSAAKWKITPLIRVVYSKHATTRYSLLSLLLRYGANVTGADDRGNSVLMHLVSKNLSPEVDLILGKVKLVSDPTDKLHESVMSIHVPPADIKHALAQTNANGQTATHFAIQPLEYGSYENTAMLGTLLDLGGILTTKDKHGRTPLDYCRDQSSRFMFRFLKREFPELVKKYKEDAFFSGVDSDQDEAMFATAPDYSEDAQAYLKECEAAGKIKRKRIEPSVNSNCDVSKGSRVYMPPGGKPSEELDALLTKVDVKNGRFGLNVFYRLQLAHDEIQGVFVLFTNWGRIGEEGKFQNTPFHSEEDAVSEFKKVFKAKTGNAWESRGQFVKHTKKYNLVQREVHHTTLDKEITMSFAEAVESSDKAVAPSFAQISNPEVAEKSVREMLTAITDIRNLQLAATEGCQFSDDLPLANQDEMKRALAKLQDIREAIKERDVVSEDLRKVSGDVTEAGSVALADLSSKHESMTERVSEMSSRYYEIMPCNEDAFGESIRAFNSVEDVDKEIVRLRLLIDIMETYKIVLGAKRKQTIVNPLDYCYDALQVRVLPLPASANEGKLLERYFFNGIRLHSRASYRISNIFEVERRGESERYLAFLDDHESFKARHSHLLWHGTRRTNMMGILSQGLRIAPPEAPHQGYAYGKGVYFADVSAKSVDYCGSPYSIESTIESENPTKSKKKTRRTVFYMLLCEVTLGESKELRAPTFYENIPEGLESVRALSQYAPDPAGCLVSPKAGTVLHLGEVGERGVKYPLDTLWAKTALEPTPTVWYLRNPVFTAETQDTLSGFVDKSEVGDTVEYTGEAPEKKHFLTYAWDDFKVTLELMSKVRDAGEKKPSGACDAIVRVRIETNGSTYSYSAQRLRNAFFHSRVPPEYEVVRPNLPAYAEYIVYNEAQARIRYVVEVEQV